jgi:hypothetical protein
MRPTVRLANRTEAKWDRPRHVFQVVNDHQRGHAVSSKGRASRSACSRAGKTVYQTVRCP